MNSCGSLKTIFAGFGKKLTSFFCRNSNHDTHDEPRTIDYTPHTFDCNMKTTSNDTSLKIVLNPTLVPQTSNLKIGKDLVQQPNLNLNNPTMYFSQYEKSTNMITPQTKNNFLNAFLVAYNCHLPIKLRPDDIHIMIELIIGTCMANNAEKLRDVFVAHKGKKEIIVLVSDFNIDRITTIFQQSIRDEIKNPEFADKMICNYSSSNHITHAVSNTLLMNTMKEYFEYSYMCLCGIPYAVLEGSIADWEKLKNFYDFLKPIFKKTELKDWFRHFDVIMDMFIEMRHLQENGEIQAPPRIAKLWERVISFVPEGSGGQTILGGWVRLFMPYGTNKKLIGGLDARVIECLNYKKEPKRSGNCYMDQDILQEFYMASGWSNIPSSCLATPLNIIDESGVKYSAEIFSGFFDPSIDIENNIITTNTGIILREKTEEEDAKLKKDVR